MSKKKVKKRKPLTEKQLLAKKLMKKDSKGNFINKQVKNYYDLFDYKSENITNSDIHTGYWLDNIKELSVEIEKMESEGFYIVKFREKRYAILSKKTNSVVLDAKGHGFKSLKSALKAYSWFRKKF